MLRNLHYIIIVTLCFAACKGPEARKPLQRNSGSFIKESAVRNKKIFEKEEAQITEIMEANPNVDYIASESGFWYFYNVKDTIASELPEFWRRSYF